MRFWRGSAQLAFVFCALAALAETDAAAQLLVAAPAAEPPAVEHAELAYALGDGPPATWLSLRVARGPVAVVAALHAPAHPAPSLDAWFAALEATASPHVLPPELAGNCGERASLLPVAWPRARGTSPSEVVVDTVEDAAAALAELGLPASEPLPAADSYLIWSWSDTTEPATTRTLRVDGEALPLSLAAGEPFPVLLSAITRGAQRYRGGLGKEALQVTFSAGERPSSDYVARLRDWLSTRPEPLLETRARGLLFDWTIYDDALSLAPLVRSYAQRAAGELPELDAEACWEQLRRLREAGATEGTACAGASDADVAFGAVSPELATLQRFALSSAAGVSPQLFEQGGEVEKPLLRASSVDASACPEQPLPPITQNPNPAAENPAARPAPVVVEEHVVVEDEPDVEVGCWGEPRPEPEQQYGYDYAEDDDDIDCSSDSSGSSDGATSGEIDCASDSSSSSESDAGEVDCSSDSSESSGAGSDDGCSGDSTTDGSDDAYDGETCTGNAAPPRQGAQQTRQARAQGSNGSGARLARARPRKLKTSVWSLAFVAVVLPIRRRKRGPRGGG